MNSKLFETAGEILSPVGLGREALSQETLSFLSTYKITTQVIEFLHLYSYNQLLRFKRVYFYRANEVAENNICDENKRCIDERLLIIGSGLNGDLIVLDLDNLQIGYVFHDELWENETIGGSREIFISMKCSIGEFYYNSLMVEGYPVDGFQAERYLGLS